jgi:5-methylcytosine-specific restriction enzyme subunit McrC
LLRQYQEEEEDLQVVRGRIVASRQFALHSNRPDRVACRFDDLTADNMWNRFIKAGLRKVRPWIASVELDRRWVELMVALDEVDDAEVDVRALDSLVFDRHAARYRMAIDWVRRILALLSPALRAGQNASPGLLFDMNLLFQTAVATVMQRRAGGSGRLQVHSQETGNYLATLTGTSRRRAFGLRPDVVLRRDGAVVAIGDAKWKRLEVGSSRYLMPAPADVYQVQAYATAFQCEQLALIYPWHSDLTASKETCFELPHVGALQPVVSVVCVDLHSDPFRALRGQGASEMGMLLAEGHAHGTERH